MITMIINPRQMGKTTKIIEEVKAHDGILLVHNFREQKRIEKEYDMKDRVFSWEQIKEKLKGHRKPVFIDNADMLLQEMCDYRIKGISMTIGE